MRKACKRGFLFSTKDGTNHKGHVAPASLVADTTEIAHVSGLKGNYCNKYTCLPSQLNGETDFVYQDNKRDEDVARMLRHRMVKAQRARNRDVAEEKRILEEYAEKDLHQ